MRKQFKKCALVGCLCTMAMGLAFGAGSLQTVSANTTAPDLQSHGASVRKADPSGLRFTFSIDESFKDAGYTFGTLVIPKNVLGDNALNHNDDAADEVDVAYEHIAQEKWATVAYQNLKAKDENHFYEEGREYFNAVLLKIPESAYGTTLVACSYAVKDGVYYYSDPVERSIAEVAAKALQGGEDGDLLVDYVDGALDIESLSMNVSNAYITVGATQVLDVLNDNGYAAIWTSSNESVATVDMSGKVTAKSAGKATISATIGSTTLTSKVQVGIAPEGDKILDFTAANVNSYAVPVADGNGNGACAISAEANVEFAGDDVMAVKVTSGYARVKLTLPGLSYMQYEKVQFYAYVEGNNQYVTGAGVVSSGVWTKAEATISGTTLTIDLRENGWNSNKGGLFYISDIYGVGSKGFTKLVDIDATNVNSVFTQKAGDGTPSYTTAKALPGEDGSMLVTVPKANSYARVKIENSDILGQYLAVQATAGYQKLAIAVYLDASGSSFTATQLIAFGGGQINLVKNAWTWLIIDAPADLAGNLDLRDSGYWQSTGMKFYVSDIYAFNPTNENIVDFTAENAANIVTPGNNITLSSQDGMLKSAYSSYSGNCSMTLTMKEVTDISGYTQIKFAVYNAQNKGIGLYVNDKHVKDIVYGWNDITVDVSTLDSLDKLKINIHQSAWNSMANDVYIISDIYGIK